MRRKFANRTNCHDNARSQRACAGLRPGGTFKGERAFYFDPAYTVNSTRSEFVVDAMLIHSQREPVRVSWFQPGQGGTTPPDTLGGYQLECVVFPPTLHNRRPYCTRWSTTVTRAPCFLPRDCMMKVSGGEAKAKEKNPCGFVQPCHVDQLW